MGKHKELLEQARELGFTKHPNGGYTKSYPVSDGNLTVVLERSGGIYWTLTLQGVAESLVQIEQVLEFGQWLKGDS